MLRRDEAGGWRFWAPTAGLRIPRPDLRSGGGPCHGARRRPSYAAARRGRRFLGSCGRSAHPTAGSGSPLRRASMGGGLQWRRAGSLLGRPGRRRRQWPAAVVPGDGRPRQPSDGLAWAAFINACEDDGGRRGPRDLRAAAAARRQSARGARRHDHWRRPQKALHSRDPGRVRWGSCYRTDGMLWAQAFACFADSDDGGALGCRLPRWGRHLVSSSLRHGFSG